MLGHENFLLTQPWPSYDPKALEEDKRLIVIQVNGKVRSRIELPASCDEKEIEQAALSDERVKRFIGDKQVKKVYVIKKKLVNVVI